MVTSVAAIGQAEQQVNQTVGTGVMNRITQAIKTAASRTGVDFAYLLNKAAQESGFDPNATTATSSATGLYQFTQQTWLQMVKNYGGQFGLGQYAGQIQVTNGVASVSDPNARQAILGLRKDPTIAAEMAGELDKSNAGALQSDVGGSIGPTELYLAHFLGAGGASQFLNAMKANPDASAATLLPQAAAANQAVFYGPGGVPRSLGQIYQHFAERFDQAPTVPTGTPGNAASSMMASAGAIMPNTVTAPAGFLPPVMPPLPNAGINLANLTTGSTIHLASATNPTNTAASAVTPGASGFAPDASSLFATMVLAQMNSGDLTRLSLSGMASGANQRKTPVLSSLGGTA